MYIMTILSTKCGIYIMRILTKVQYGPSMCGSQRRSQKGHKTKLDKINRLDGERDKKENDKNTKNGKYKNI